jgi:hypothetical protein
MKLGAVCGLALALAGCQSTQNVWLRTDGRRATSSPQLSQQFDLDATVCQGERQKASMSGVQLNSGGLMGVAEAMERGQAADDVTKGCMAQRGYLLVPREVAEARARS